MSDVPTTAWWVMSSVLVMRAQPRASLLAGLAGAAAIVTRPNLAPLAVPLTLYAWRAGPPCGLRLLAGVAPGVIVTTALNSLRFGSWARSGYGDSSALFAVSNILPNVVRYPAWLSDAHTPFLALAVVAPLLVGRSLHRTPLVRAWRGHGGRTPCLPLRFRRPCSSAIYRTWSSKNGGISRFVLPALPFLIALSVTAAFEICRRISARFAIGLTAVICVLLMGSWVCTADRLNAFRLQAFERHFVDAGHFVASRLPGNAVVLTVKNSGSVRFYSGRSVVLWDVLEPAALDGIVSSLEAAGHAMFLLLESEEEQPFKDRFRDQSALGNLDWPPLARIGTTIKVFEVAARARYFRGESVRSERLFSPVPRTPVSGVVGEQ